MRVVVDLQAAQRDLLRGAPADNFGLQLALHLLRTRGEHEVLLLASGLHADTIETLRDLLRAAGGDEAIRQWSSVSCRDFTPQPANWRLAGARLVKQAALAAWRPDVLVVPVPAGSLDHSALPVFPARVPVLAVVQQEQGANAQDPRVLELLAACGFGAEPAHPARHASMRVTGAELAQQPDTDAAGVWAAATRLARERFEAPLSAPDGARPRLAYVSPLPPERSGIADYSAMLLPALSRHYDIDLVAPQREVSDPWLAEHGRLLTPQQFRDRHAQYERVLYHFGNSSFHEHMFDLLRDIPGVVVLHDVFLGDIQLIREQRGVEPHAWTRALYDGHGWRALIDRFDPAKLWETLGRYPANLGVIREAQGLIVHSDHARRLAEAACGAGAPVDWAVIPLARTPQPLASRAAAREKLGLAADAFIVCSVGFINRAKLHDRIVAAWRESRLARDPAAQLVFVGGADESFGASLQAAIAAAHLDAQVRITGWVDGPTYHDWLDAADVCVQLRTQSRGETSAAVLDCMGHGRATIVNANGSMAELPEDSVWRLPDVFSDEELARGLETLRSDPGRRERMGEQARRLIAQHHAPDVCAAQYAAAIEQFAARAPARLPSVARALGAAAGPHASNRDLAALALALTRSVPQPGPSRQLLVDVSAIARSDLKTGIQRVVRALVWEFIQAPPPGWRIEPVFMSSEGEVWHYRHARSWTARMLGLPDDWTSDDVVEFAAGDVLLIADFTSGYVVESERVGLFEDLRQAGVRLEATVYDLLPLRMPQMFPPGARDTHAAWFAAVARSADGVLCISKAVADEVAEEVAALAPARGKPLRIGWFHLGADLDGSMPSGGVPPEAAEVLARLAERPTFLMVGTLEPRKGHAHTLAGFERLWARGEDVNLVVVGKRGWLVDEVCDRMRAHPEAGRRLFWIEGASDEYLMRLYEASQCLIAASEGEGFGLPLIEAAQHGLPIIARDIPVFREVAGEHASYFSGEGDALADAVHAWLERARAGDAPASRGMRWLTWRESAQRVLECLGLEGSGAQTVSASRAATRSNSTVVGR